MVYIPRQQILTRFKRYKELNETRLMRAKSLMSNDARFCLSIVPVLLHYNHINLPGYRGNNVPQGIDLFTLDEVQKNYLHDTILPGAPALEEPKERAILGLYAMGSSSSLGQTDSSDVDIWVCVRANLSPEATTALQDKCRFITAYVKAQGVDLNLFVTPEDRFTNFHPDSLDEENCGSAQNLFLLDEFYRSSIRLCGRYIIWYLVSTKEEQQSYQDYVDFLTKGISGMAHILEQGEPLGASFGFDLPNGEEQEARSDDNSPISAKSLKNIASVPLNNVGQSKGENRLAQGQVQGAKRSLAHKPWVDTGLSKAHEEFLHYSSASGSVCPVLANHARYLSATKIQAKKGKVKHNLGSDIVARHKSDPRAAITDYEARSYLDYPKDNQLIHPHPSVIQELPSLTFVNVDESDDFEIAHVVRANEDAPKVKRSSVYHTPYEGPSCDLLYHESECTYYGDLAHNNGAKTKPSTDDNSSTSSAFNANKKHDLQANEDKGSSSQTQVSSFAVNADEQVLQPHDLINSLQHRKVVQELDDIEQFTSHVAKAPVSLLNWSAISNIGADGLLDQNGALPFNKDMSINADASYVSGQIDIDSFKKLSRDGGAYGNSISDSLLNRALKLAATKEHQEIVAPATHHIFERSNLFAHSDGHSKQTSAASLSNSHNSPTVIQSSGSNRTLSSGIEFYEDRTHKFNGEAESSIHFFAPGFNNLDSDTRAKSVFGFVRNRSHKLSFGFDAKKGDDAHYELQAHLQDLVALKAHTAKAPFLDNTTFANVSIVDGKAIFTAESEISKEQEDEHENSTLTEQDSANEHSNELTSSKESAQESLSTENKQPLLEDDLAQDDDAILDSLSLQDREAVVNELLALEGSELLSDGSNNKDGLEQASFIHDDSSEAIWYVQKNGSHRRRVINPERRARALERARNMSRNRALAKMGAATENVSKAALFLAKTASFNMVLPKLFPLNNDGKAGNNKRNNDLFSGFTHQTSGTWLSTGDLNVQDSTLRNFGSVEYGERHRSILESPLANSQINNQRYAQSEAAINGSRSNGANKDGSSQDLNFEEQAVSSTRGLGLERLAAAMGVTPMAYMGNSMLPIELIAKSNSSERNDLVIDPVGRASGYDSLGNSNASQSRWGANANDYGLKNTFRASDQSASLAGQQGEGSTYQHNQLGDNGANAFIEGAQGTKNGQANTYPQWSYGTILSEDESVHAALLDGFREYEAPLDPDEWFDFGSVVKNSPTEYFGSGLWLLYKAIDSPFKVVLKILLMEAYSNDYPNTNLLSSQLKDYMLSHDGYSLDLDSYYLMYLKVSNYLQEGNHEDRLRLMRKCFYLKIFSGLNVKSATHREDFKLKRQLLDKFFSRWGWSKDFVEDLEQFSSWKMASVRSFNYEVYNTLLESYQALLRFSVRHGIEYAITSDDAGILSRKLYAAFDHYPGKITVMHTAFSHNLEERHLTFIKPSEQSLCRKGWHIYNAASNDVALLNLKASYVGNRLTEAVTWACFNGILTPRTSTYVTGATEVVTPFKIRQLSNDIIRVLGNQRWRVSENALQRTVRPRACLVVLNLEHDDTELLKQQVFDIDFGSTLCCGRQRVCLVGSVDVIMTNTWGEVRSISFPNGEEGVVELLASLLRIFSNCIQADEEDDSIESMLSRIEVCSYAANYQDLIKFDLESTIRQVFNCFNSKNSSEYTFDVGRNTYVARDQRERGVVINKRSVFGNNEYDISVLSRYGMRPEFALQVPAVVDRYATAGVMQYFFSPLNRGHWDIYVVNERNEVSTYKNYFGSRSALVNAINRFYTNQSENQVKHGVRFNLPQYFVLSADLNVIRPFTIAGSKD